VVEIDRDLGLRVVGEHRAEVVREAAAGHLGAVLSYDPEPKVSVDFNHTTPSSIFAPDQTRVVGGRTVRVLAWYDNEWGFSARMADVAAVMGQLAQ
jgi:glyceraldehyde 3-phosphate dehydrogenase